MIKLFLVEDEIVMREGIKKHIPWDAEDIDFVGEAGDGELALPMILEKRPDILITDIKMPFMDGLQLSEIVKKKLPDTRIIILSGYDDFSYAQKAIACGVTQYLLKPVAPGKLLECIRTVRDDILKSRESGENDWSALAVKEKKRAAMERFFRSMVIGQQPVAELYEEGAKLGINLSAIGFSVILVRKTDDEKSHSLELFMEAIEKAMEEYKDCYVFDRGENPAAILVTFQPECDKDSYLKDIMASLDTSMRAEVDDNYFAGVGNITDRLSEISSSYKSANFALAYRFLVGNGRTVRADNIAIPDGGNDSEKKEALDINPLVTNENLHSVVLEFLRTGTGDETEAFSARIIQTVGEKNINSMIFRNYLTIEVYLVIARFMKDEGIDENEVNSLCGDVNAAIIKNNTSKDVQDYLTLYLKTVIRFRDAKRERSNESSVKAAAEYINEHYMEPDLSLDAVAAVENMSPGHFSRLFSRIMGTTYIEYLIKKRIDCAKEYLINTDMRSSEIAFKTGYTDPHYFSTTFKKITGMSPKDYRNRGKA